MRRVLPLAVVLLLAGCGGGKHTSTTASSTCATVSKPGPKSEPHLSAPTTLLSASKTYRTIVSTSCGQFEITLNPAISPHASASFVSLVQHGFFDNTFFHRIVPGFVIQGGDPTGTGTGGPGYTTVDQPPSKIAYTRNIVAMAKTGSEPPGTAGSQFFVVTGQNAQLPPDYAVLGQVTSGQDVVARIGRYGHAATGEPTKIVVIDMMTVATS